MLWVLAVAQYAAQKILNKLREFGKTGERKMTPLEERYAMKFLGGRKGNTLKTHLRALVHGTTAAGAVATPDKNRSESRFVTKTFA